MLVDGEWKTNRYEITNEDGEFDRQETTLRDSIDGDRYEVESGRYHLYISRACPWAHGTAMARNLLELEEHVSLSLVEPVRYDEGWEFSDRYPDPNHDNFSYLREVYQSSNKDFTGRVTVPVLYDKKTDSIVNNESSEILMILNDSLSDLSDGGVDLYPDNIRDKVIETIDDIYEPINNGVYRAGFADSQEAYNSAIRELFSALDYWDEVLSDQRYLTGDVLTAADLRMFATLVRFDSVYNTHFKCSKSTVREYNSLWGYTRDIYQKDGITQTVNMEHIVKHYYMSHDHINPKRLVATVPDIDFTEPHDRSQL